jgi:FMN-dependent NADH-azoreductase
MDFVEPYLKAVFGWLGTSYFASVAVEYDEFGGKTLEQSFAEAEHSLNQAVQSWSISIDAHAAQGSTVAA